MPRTARSCGASTSTTGATRWRSPIGSSSSGTRRCGSWPAAAHDRRVRTDRRADVHVRAPWVRPGHRRADVGHRRRTLARTTTAWSVRRSMVTPWCSHPGRTSSTPATGSIGWRAGEGTPGRARRGHRRRCRAHRDARPADHRARHGDRCAAVDEARLGTVRRSTSPPVTATPTSPIEPTSSPTTSSPATSGGASRTSPRTTHGRGTSPTTRSSRCGGTSRPGPPSTAPSRGRPTTRTGTSRPARHHA